MEVYMARQIPVASPLALMVLAAALFDVHPAAAQTTTAVLQGVVTDANHAVVPGARVTLRNAGTGFERATATDRTGAYVLSLVPAGTYDLTIELDGFKTVKREGLRLEVGQQFTIDATLEVASIAETITIREAAPVVETTKSTLDLVVR